MDPIAPSGSIHPAGETAAAVSTSWPIDTPGGRYYAEWEPDAPVSVHGQLAFFAQFLHAGKRWDEFIADCPLHYSGNRGSGARNVFGTAALSVLCGHWRYLHMNAVRGDVLNAGLLGISHLVSDEVVRHALNHVIDESAALAWLTEHQRRSLESMLTLPWILDIDSTVKPLNGRQQGAEIGYNPHKPGCPSHVYHSYFVAGLRVCVGVEVLPGKEHAVGHGQPGLWRTLEALPRPCWPAFIRADCGYGQEKLLCECEERGVPYLFKLRFTKKVRELVSNIQHKGAGWEDTGDGWQVLESTLRLTGWSRARRIVIVREAAARAPVEENPAHRAVPGRRRGKDRSLLPGAEAPDWQSAAPWSGKLAVLVTSLGTPDYPAVSLAKLYRERGDMENNYDELKNQWGWNGYTTKKMAPRRIMANLIALISGVARETRHGGQRRVKVSLLHEKGGLIARAITLISSFLHRVSIITARWTAVQCWSLLLTRILRGKLGGKWLGDLPPGAQRLLSG